MNSAQSDTTELITTPGWKPWRELAVLGLLVMDLCWLIPWYRSLTPVTYSTSPERVLLVFAWVIFTLHLSTRFLNRIRLRIKFRRIVMVMIVVLNLWLAMRYLLYKDDQFTINDWLFRPFQEMNSSSGLIPDEFLVGIFVLVLVWRGIGHAQVYIEPNTVRRNFLLGILMFVAYIFMNTIITGETPGVFLYLFFLFGCLALGAARISAISSLRGGVRVPFNRGWFLGMVAGTTAVVSLASLVAWLFNERFLFVQQVANVFMGLFGLIMVAVISPVIYLMQAVFSERRVDPDIMQNIVQAMDGLRAAVSGMANSLTGWMDRIGFFVWGPRLKPLLLWGFLVFLAFLIISGLVRWVIREAVEKREERESLSGGEVWNIIKQSVRSRLRKLSEDLGMLAGIRPGFHMLAAARIRRIYAQLMGLSEKLGNPRPPATTPLEFLPRLHSLFPGLENELVVITQAYLRVRYGELPETQADLDEVEDAWDRILTEGNHLLELRQKTSRKTTSQVR